MMTADDLSTREKKRYIKNNMKQIGAGSSRVVYEMGDNKTVVKYARSNNKGVAQNLAEYEIFISGKDYLTILCPIMDISEDNETLIMGKAISIQKRDIPIELKAKFNAFKRKLKWIRNKLDTVLCSYQKEKPRTIREIKERIRKYNLKQEEKNILRSRLFEQICEIILHFGLLKGDVVANSSWGYYKGKFVLVDYGCTREIYKTHYGAKYIAF